MIVFEGINKTGKTRLASEVSKNLLMPIVRVVNVSANKGLAPLKQSIESYGVKTNDFYEDLVIMEYINQTGFNNVILDRSIPSSSAYRYYKQDKVMSNDIMEYWFKSLKNNDGLYVWVDVRWTTVKKRGLKIGWLETEKQYNDLHKIFGYMYLMAKEMGVKTLHLKNETEFDYYENLQMIYNAKQ